MKEYDDIHRIYIDYLDRDLSDVQNTTNYGGGFRHGAPNFAGAPSLDKRLFCHTSPKPLLGIVRSAK